MNYRTVSLSCAALVLAANTAGAQDDRGVFFRADLGIARGGTEVGGSTNSSLGVTFGGQAGWSGSVVDVALDVVVQPFKVENPRRPEAFTALYVLPSIGVHWAGAYVRGGLGWSRLGFSGSNVFVDVDGGPAVGAAIGYRPKALKRRIGIEAFTMLTVSSDGELGASLTGVRFTLASYSGK